MHLAEIVATSEEVATTRSRKARAAMMAGSTIAVAAALTSGESALAEFVPEVGRPVQPMLASSAPTVVEAISKIAGDGLEIEVAFDGVQRSTRYSGGVALRFARPTRSSRSARWSDYRGTNRTSVDQASPRSSRSSSLAV